MESTRVEYGVCHARSVSQTAAERAFSDVAVAIVGDDHEEDVVALSVGVFQ